MWLRGLVVKTPARLAGDPRFESWRSLDFSTNALLYNWHLCAPAWRAIRAMSVSNGFLLIAAFPETRGRMRRPKELLALTPREACRRPRYLSKRPRP